MNTHAGPLAITAEDLMETSMAEDGSQAQAESSDLPPTGWLPLSPAPGISSKRDMTRDELTTREQAIEHGKKAFVEVGAALLDIRDRRGYRFEYATFEEYCRKRWDFGRVYAHRLIEAAEITANLLPMGNVAGKLDLSDPATWPEGVKLPENERQTRPLAGLEPEQQREAWQRVVATAPDGRITARDVESVVKTFSPPKPRVNWSEYATSASDDETQIMKWIIDLYNAGQPFDADVTFSQGTVWRGLPEPRHKSDLKPVGADVQKMDARHLKFKAGTLGSIYFDPPHIAKDVERDGAKLGVIEARFSGYKSMSELWRMYGDALKEFHRVLEPGGIVAFKVTDTISGGKFCASSVEVINQARAIGFSLAYIMVLYHRGAGIMSPNMQHQLNPRHNHCFYLVLVKEDEG